MNTVSTKISTKEKLKSAKAMVIFYGKCLVIYPAKIRQIFLPPPCSMFKYKNFSSFNGSLTEDKNTELYNKRYLTVNWSTPGDHSENMSS